MLNLDRFSVPVHRPLPIRRDPRCITVECFCPTVGSPNDRYEATATATFIVTHYSLDLLGCSLFVNGVASLEDIPGAYMDRLERKARKEFDEGDEL